MKKPAGAGFMETAKPFGSAAFALLASGARADHFDFHAAILRAAFGGLVVGDRLLLALAFRVDTVGFDALGRQVGLDRLGTPDRQLVVVRVATDAVGVADGDDD